LKWRIILRNKFYLIITIIELLFFIFIAALYSQEEKIFSRAELVQDTRQLVQFLESAHPDPYIRGGGKIAFHRRFQEIMRAIPDEGMTKEEYYKLLLPFVAAVGDGHTRIFFSESRKPSSPGLALDFNIVESKLYVAGVYDENHKSMLGATLFSIEGVSFAELVERQASLRGCDNEHHKLANLSKSLKAREGLASLIPEWKDKDAIHMVLSSPKKEKKEYLLTFPDKIRRNPIAPPSKINMPSVDRTDFVYKFLDEKKQIALLRVDGMFNFRENFELCKALGIDMARQYAEKAYEKFHKTKPPEDYQEIIKGLPSATKTFRSLVREMKEASTKALLIDLRKNDGGNSFMSNILIYFLYGSHVFGSLDEGFTIKKYSDLYFDQYSKDSIENINKERILPLIKNDYDFKSVLEFKSEEQAKQESKEEDEKLIELMPTFRGEYKSGKHSGYYLPNKIVVLCSPVTYSSGFTMMLRHYTLGATLVGTPSAQAGNSFGDVLNFKLDNTCLFGTISYKYGEDFPGDTEKGRILKPHYILTYDKLYSYNFDPNAEILLALEILPKIK